MVLLPFKFLRALPRRLVCLVVVPEQSPGEPAFGVKTVRPCRLSRVVSAPCPTSTCSHRVLQLLMGLNLGRVVVLLPLELLRALPCRLVRLVVVPKQPPGVLAVRAGHRLCPTVRAFPSGLPIFPNPVHATVGVGHVPQARRTLPGGLLGSMVVKIGAVGVHFHPCQAGWFVPGHFPGVGVDVVLTARVVCAPLGVVPVDCMDLPRPFVRWRPAGLPILGHIEIRPLVRVPLPPRFGLVPGSFPRNGVQPEELGQLPRGLGGGAHCQRHGSQDP
mmetsp:Transcript_64925/g.148993  ORF Transcript_64925/g.148993 Transcript_64925/m.148993 type:complete len:274 (-) Transcript_64925:35-856(-)